MDTDIEGAHIPGPQVNLTIEGDIMIENKSNRSIEGIMSVQDPEIEVMTLEKENEATHTTDSQGEKIDPKTQT